MEENQFYHIYNRGNNRQPIFFEERNYTFFIEKIRKHIHPHLCIVAYCLMPNHFHILAYTDENFDKEAFSIGLRIMLSSYTRAINNQNDRVGSLFQQNTKIKLLEFSRSTTLSGATTDVGDPFVCFHYIHQNPIRANLVKSMKDWPYSFYQDYAGLRTNTLCNKQIAYDYLEIPANTGEFESISQSVRL